jgi:hypothetical protein
MVVQGPTHLPFYNSNNDEFKNISNKNVKEIKTFVFVVIVAAK